MNTLLQWFVTSSVLILAVLALRRLLGGRISPRVKYALWAVVLVRLLVPFQLPTPHLPTAAELTPEPTSLTQTTIPLLPATYSMEEVATGQAPNLTFDDQGQLHTDRDIGEVKPSADGQRAVFSLVWLSPAQLLLGLWAMGAIILALVLLGSNLRFFLRLRRRRTPVDLADGPLPVYTVEGLPSPCLFGLFRPCIYLTPDLALGSPTRTHVLAHELTHYRQKDHIWSALRCAALALHWYNPLVWLAVALSKRDGELSCDAGAVQVLGEEERIPYGRTLVSLVAQRSLRPGDLLSCSTSMAEGKGSIQNRIAQLVKRSETKKTALFAVVALAALAVVFTFGSGQNQPEESIQDGDPSYWDQVQNAQSIQYSPPLYSSAAFPDAIADADLLEEAKTLLSQAKAPDSSALDADWTEPLFSASTISLVNPDNSMSRYYLCTLDGHDYLVTPAQLNAEEYTPVAVFPQDAGVVESALATLAQQQSERNAAVSSEDASTSTPVTAHMVDQAQRLQNLEPDQIQSVYGGPYQKDSDLANSILTTLKEEAKNLIPTPEPQLYDLYSLWEVYLQIDEEDFWELSAGTVSSIVAVRIDQDTIYFHAPKLYELIHQWWTPPDNAITVTTPAVLQTMDQVLAEEKEAVQKSSEFPDAYRSAQLISLHRLASFDNQADGSTVNIYGYDSGFVMDDLSNISWRGDAWVDGQMLYHPDNAYHHLITVEQNGKVAQYVTVTNDFPLDPESYASHTDSQLSLGEYAALQLGLKG
ncbi:M56 family metallopeptidase [Pseudoflavonifractor phocaeensis]|uniref:M56 family metallopeptidase n=1 Tax=Pseudoflavonifractor phocaeensis TaxID=1870988 RepID=UPI0025A4BF0E|nr:M56 family metallopeptidase [Pseudoflavonifractor phocaeensis]MDM8240149.1 M56 family metallopeptidase [Pseudoflavonifractor phocaeensis]